MPFERPTLQEIYDRMVSDIQTRVENSESLLRRSILRILARVYSGAIYLLYSYLNFLKNQLFATSADAENLELIGSEFGITRKAATFASGEATATGTNGVNIPSGTQLQSPSGNFYVVDEDVAISGGFANVEFTASSSGTDSNDDASISLTFVTPIAGINTTLTVDSNGITGGVDQESDDDLRDRILTRKRQPPHGGAEFDYETWALEVSGVTRAWSIPQYQGVGTIGLAFVRDNDTSTIIPNETQRAEVRDYIVQHTDPLTGLEVGIPVTAEPGFFVLELSYLSIDFNIDLLPNNSSVQSSVQTNLDELLVEKGGPGQTIYLTDITQAVGKATGEITHKLNSPSADIAIPVNRIPRLGTITYGDY